MTRAALSMSGGQGAVRIVVVRNDKIGDFMLAWPTLALLRRSLPQAHISVLVPAYTQDLAQQCPWIDQVLLDPIDVPRLNRANFDVVLTLFSTPRIGWQVWRGRIPMRVAPATKWAQVFYNHRVVQRRSQSRQPEYVYNLELGRHVLQRLSAPVADNPAPFWPVSAAQRDRQRRMLADALSVSADRPWVYVHAGSGGSAVNLSVTQYAELINRLNADWPGPVAPVWLLTAGPGESALADAVYRQVNGQSLDVVVYQSSQGLAAFAWSLCAADMLIAGSTGPLHIAAAQDVPTVGFFPAKRSATALRWQPCNGPGRSWAVSAPVKAGTSENPMRSVQIADVIEPLTQWIRTTVLSG